MPTNRKASLLARTLALLSVQIAGSAGALYLAACLRFIAHPRLLESCLADLWPKAVVFAILTVLGLAALGLYRRRGRRARREVLAQMALGMGIAGVGLMVVFYLVPPLYVGRGVTLLALLLAGPVEFGSLRAFQRVVDHDALKSRVLVYGCGATARRLLDCMGEEGLGQPTRLLGFVPVAGETVTVPTQRLLALGEDALPGLVQRERVDEIVIATDDRRGRLPLEDLMRLRCAGIVISEAADFCERHLGKLVTDLLWPSSLLLSPGFRQDRLGEALKRGLDVAGSLVILVLASPLMLLAATAILVEDGFRAPVFYRQTRVGRHGVPFQLFKFRSMRTDAEADGRARWASERDERVTRVGRFLRRHRIDELPQLFNVLVGEMSLVGPRPERPEFVDRLSRINPYYELRHSVRPGLTGLAQISYPYGACERDAIEKLNYDLYYVKHASPVLDLYLLLVTTETILLGRGSR